MTTSLGRRISYSALAVGLAAVVSAFTLTSTRAGEGLIFGLGAFIAFFALSSLLVRDGTAGHWGLVVVGLAMFMLPALGAGFVPDRGAAWTGWLAGALAMLLGGFGWLNGKPPTAYGLDEYGSRDTKPGPLAGRISRAALAVGLLTAVLGAAVTGSSSAGAMVSVGAGTLIAVIAVWSLQTADPTRDFMTLATVGFALLVAPVAVGFAADPAAWTAWVAGAVTTTLGITGYLRGTSREVAETVREQAHAVYLAHYR
jgi:hypothetical protein